MPLGSVFAKDLALDACYGDNKADIWPDTVYLAFYDGDPTSGGTELTGTAGITRIALAATTANFADAAAAVKANAAPWTSSTSTGAWASSADHWAFLDNAIGGNMLDTGQIVDSLGSPTTLDVTAVNTTVVVPVGDWQLTQS